MLQWCVISPESHYQSYNKRCFLSIFLSFFLCVSPQPEDVIAGRDLRSLKVCANVLVARFLKESRFKQREKSQIALIEAAQRHSHKHILSCWSRYKHCRYNWFPQHFPPLPLLPLLPPSWHLSSVTPRCKYSPHLILHSFKHRLSAFLSPSLSQTHMFAHTPRNSLALLIGHKHTTRHF